MTRRDGLTASTASVNGRLIATHLLAATPPTWQHPQHANNETRGEGEQHHDNQWRSPFISEEKVRDHFMLIIQREGEQGEKNGCFQYPPKQP
jgi:hypothetical protein